MQSQPRRHLEWIWLAAFVLLVSLHWNWLPRLNRGPQHDTYSTSADGKKAFYLIARDRGYLVSRNQKRLTSLVESSPGYETLALLGPAQYPTDSEWSAIMSWVGDGGTLLVAARSGKGGEKVQLEIPDLGIKVVRNSGSFRSTDVDTPMMTGGQFIWQSGGEIETTGTSEPDVFVEAGGTVQAIGVPHGSGYVVAVASDFIFSNQSLAWSDYSNAELAIRLLDKVERGGNIYVDESLNASGTPKVVGLLLEPFLWPVTVQLLIGLLLFAWWRSRQFGPLLPRSVTARHNIVDHTDTLGMLYFKSGEGTIPLRSYLKQLEADLRISSVPGAEDRTLAPIAARLGKSVEAMRKLFHRARKYAEVSNLDRKTAARAIHRLAQIRQAMRQRPEPTVVADPDDDS